MKFISKSDKDTKDFAKKLAQIYKGGIFALTGDLGAGKTTFTQGFAEGLNIKDKIISPTFVLQRQHPIPNTQKLLHHIDLYRLDEDFQFNQLGLDEILDSDNFVLIEWAEKIEKSLPQKTIKINFKKLSENERQLEIS